MSLYIGNTTKQTMVHCFRLPESHKMNALSIESGHQEKIGDGWTSDQTDAVIQHLELYGARRSNETGMSMKGFTGLLYSVDKPITETQIVSGHDAVVDTQELRSATEATRSALAFDRSTRANKGKGKRLAKVTEVEVVEDIQGNQKPTGKEVKFSMSVSEQGSETARIPV